MGVVTYTGPPARVTLSTGQSVDVQSGISYTFPDVDCTSLLAEYPARWAAGDQHTATLLPVAYADDVPLGSFAKAAYSSTVTYMRGQVVNSGGIQFVCLTDGTVGLDPATNPSNWIQQQSGSVILGSTGGGIPVWAPTTFYALNQSVQHNGTVYVCINAHTSGSAFFGAGANWDYVSGIQNRRPVAQRLMRDLTWANSLSVPLTTSSTGILKRFAIAVLGDSTGVDSDANNVRWPHLLGLSLAALFPNIQVNFYQWSDANQAWGAPTIINPLGSPNAALDIFNGSISGTTSDYWLRSGSKSITQSGLAAAFTSDLRQVTVSSTAVLLPGSGLSGNGAIPSGTRIESIDSATQFTMSAAATATSSAQSFTALTPRRLDTVAAVNPDVVFISHGHNENAFYGFVNDPARFSEKILALTESVTQACRAKIVLVAQNEQVSPAASASPLYQGVHAQELRALATLCGYDFVDAYDAFHSLGAALTAGGTWITADGVHPTYDPGTSVIGNPASGSALWRDAVYNAMRLVPGWQDKSQDPSGFQRFAGPANGQVPSSRQLLINGDFSEYTTSGGSGTGTPNGWLVNGTLAFAKDATNFEYPYTSSLQATASAATTNQCYLQQKVAGTGATWTMDRFRGRWVTLAVRQRWSASVARSANLGKLSIDDGVSTNIQTIAYSLCGDPDTNGWHWLLCRRWIPYNATRLWALIYVDSGTDNAQANVLSVQRAIFAIGQRPMDVV